MFEKGLFLKIRYVFRYPQLGLPSATECSKVLQSAELTCQLLPKTPKIPNTMGHVAVVKNISNVVVNKPRDPENIRVSEVFL